MGSRAGHPDNLGFLTAFLGFPVLTFLPVIVKDVFNQDVAFYSRLMTFSGAGAVRARWSSPEIGKHRHIGVMLLFLGRLRRGDGRALVFAQRLLSAASCFHRRFLLVICLSLTTSLVQLLAPAELRGRVVSIYMVAFRGGSPLGGLVSGWLVTQLGSAPRVLAINGALLMIVAIVALTRDHGLRDV